MKVKPTSAPEPAATTAESLAGRSRVSAPALRASESVLVELLVAAVAERLARSASQVPLRTRTRRRLPAIVPLRPAIVGVAVHIPVGASIDVAGRGTRHHPGISAGGIAMDPGTGGTGAGTERAR